MPGVLCKDINRVPGDHYDAVKVLNIRLFFVNDKVSVLYLARRSLFAPEDLSAVIVLQKFNDLRRIGGALALAPGISAIWRDASRMPPDFDPVQALMVGTNPGLGVRDPHAQGPAGGGVSFAIIDQPMCLDPPGFASKVTPHRDFETQAESSMHGPRHHLLLRCRSLPEPGCGLLRQSPGGDSRGEPQAAAQDGVLVLDCTQHRGIIWSCWHTGCDLQDPANCAPGYPGQPPGETLLDRILAPTSPRTTAEQSAKADYSYRYTGRGGLSWVNSYVAGVLALGWQERPQLDVQQTAKLICDSAYTNDGAAKLINPKEFIRMLREFQP